MTRYGLRVAALCAACAGTTWAQDQFVPIFSGSVAGAGQLAGSARAPNGDYWLAGTGPGSVIRRVTDTGSGFVGDTYVPFIDWAFFMRSDDVPGGTTNPDLGGQIGGSAGALLLNPAPLTIDVPIGGGSTQAITYPAGTLAFIADNVGLNFDNGVAQPQLAKKLYRYDLRKIDDPTSASPDFATASNGPPDIGGFVFGSIGTADWNDVFQPVVSEQDLRNESGSDGGDLFGREFGWSSDGQTIYAVDSSSGQGGIYRIDPTRTANASGGIDLIWQDNDDGPPEVDATRIRSEPGVLHTSVYDYAPSSPLLGEQIIVEGSFLSGNTGGVNVFVDDGSATLAPPTPLFTQQEFRDFADYYGSSEPFFQSIAAAPSGDLYISESNTRLLFRYDTQGRFAKVFGEQELDAFQESQTNSPNNDVVTNLSLSTSMEAGFETPEITYVDIEIGAPVAVLDFKTGDFDRDDDLDATDLADFAAALTTRNTAVDPMLARFDLNGNEEAFRNTNSQGEPIVSRVSNGPPVVDWRDVKILQQFALFPDGDTNFDLTLDFTDLDTMAANYFTLPGQTEETWVTGDFASIDPGYIFDAPDANLVNEVDLAVIADAWLNDLGLPAPTEAELNARYTGQFLIDVIAAFDNPGGLVGDYDLDGDVDHDDYLAWTAVVGSLGGGQPEDGSEDGAVGAEDFVVWREAVAANPITGDYDRDGDVDQGDFDAWAASLDETGADLRADGNGDGVVGPEDFAIWREALVIDPLAGDFNDDGAINSVDYALWREAVGQPTAPLVGDADGDRQVDQDDYDLWAAQYGTTANLSVTVPEPASLVLLGLGAGVALGLRRERP